jgi:integrase
MIHLDYYVGKNPMGKVEKVKADSNRERFLTQGEAKKLLDALKKKDSDLYIQSSISLLTGLRRTEIFNLHGRDIDLDNEIIHVRETKDSKEFRGRKVNISKKLKQILSTIQISPNRKLFNSSKHFKRYSFNAVINKLKLNEGVENDRKHKVTFHTLRHTFASWLAQQGESLLTIKELMGHKTIEMTMRYAHLIPDQKKDAVNRLSDRFLEN